MGWYNGPRLPERLHRVWSQYVSLGPSPCTCLRHSLEIHVACPHVCCVVLCVRLGCVALCCVMLCWVVMGWVGLDWVGLGWVGLGWVELCCLAGLVWSGMVWYGIWSGLVWSSCLVPLVERSFCLFCCPIYSYSFSSAFEILEAQVFSVV